MGDLGTTPCLEVLYLFEWGVSVATDEEGAIVGYYRRYVYGTVTFARGVGPIRCRERMVLAGSHGLTTTKVVDMEAALVRFDVAGR